MARKIRIFNKLFEIVGQPDRVELQNRVKHVEPCRVHIPMNHAQGVEVRNSRCQLPEQT
jgi:hypothetical protein